MKPGQLEIIEHGQGPALFHRDVGRIFTGQDAKGQFGRLSAVFPAVQEHAAHDAVTKAGLVVGVQWNRTGRGNKPGAFSPAEGPATTVP